MRNEQQMQREEEMRTRAQRIAHQGTSSECIRTHTWIIQIINVLIVSMHCFNIYLSHSDNSAAEKRQQRMDNARRRREQAQEKGAREAVLKNQFSYFLTNNHEISTLFYPQFVALQENRRNSALRARNERERRLQQMLDAKNQCQRKGTF